MVWQVQRFEARRDGGLMIVVYLLLLWLAGSTKARDGFCTPWQGSPSISSALWQVWLTWEALLSNELYLG